MEPSPPAPAPGSGSARGSMMMMGAPALPPLEGWLEKQGGRRKNWKRRYFQLDGKRLKYFAKESDCKSDKAIDYIPLERTTKVVEVPDAVRPGSKYAGCAFSIRTSFRDYFLIAASREERQRWLAQLRNSISLLYNIAVDSSEALSSSSLNIDHQSSTEDLSGSFSPRNVTSPMLSLVMPSKNEEEGEVSPSSTSPYSVKPPPSDLFDREATSSNSDLTLSMEEEEEEEQVQLSQRQLQKFLHSGNATRLPFRKVKSNSGVMVEATNTPAQKHLEERVHCLENELNLKDKVLRETRQKLRSTESALTDLSEKYFVSVAIFAKMNAVQEGRFKNVDVHRLYSRVLEEQIPITEWPQWITRQVMSD
ncbi:Pleckstrin y domain-containing A member 2 [Balamuthia mandrillaris]